MAEKIDIRGAPETMLQTLYARAKASQTEPHYIYDEKSIEIVAQLDYDFSAADKDVAMSSGVLARTIVLERMVSAYLARNPGAVVVNIACGLDTRCYRMEGYSRWYNLDLLTKRLLRTYGPALYGKRDLAIWNAIPKKRNIGCVLWRGNHDKSIIRLPRQYLPERDVAVCAAGYGE